jgi:hypothetical protein
MPHRSTVKHGLLVGVLKGEDLEARSATRTRKQSNASDTTEDAA